MAHMAGPGPFTKMYYICSTSIVLLINSKLDRVRECRGELGTSTIYGTPAYFHFPKNIHVDL